MLDRHEAQDARNDLGYDHRDDANDRPVADRPLADREVPLPGTADASAEAVTAVQQWLDGDLSEVDARRTDAKQVEFWNRMASETDRRRRMTTPAHVSAQIMAALPQLNIGTDTATSLATATALTAEPAPASGFASWMMIVVGTAFFAIGIVVGKMFA